MFQRVSAGLVDSGRGAEDGVLVTFERDRKKTRRERRAAARRESRAVVRSETVIGTALAAALAPKGPTVPRSVGRYIIHETEGALGGAGFAGNGRVCLTCQLDADIRSAWGRGKSGAIELFETSDPFDRAHCVTTLSVGFQRELVPAGREAWRRSNSGEPMRCARAMNVEGARPRKYPRSSMLASGISTDSAFDWLHDARRRLAGIPGVGLDDDEDDVRTVVAGVRFRDLVRRATR